VPSVAPTPIAKLRPWIKQKEKKNISKGPTLGPPLLVAKLLGCPTLSIEPPGKFPISR
jgi:hypothetical protein